jgi:hypothetical protein
MIGGIARNCALGKISLASGLPPDYYAVNPMVASCQDVNPS